ncbi:MAG TPA: MFS transporter [Ktedonobacterales bacterium]|nr:MFS transporter [Ktedonobacterales bacterium]
MALASPAPFARDRFTWLAYLMLGFYAYLEAALGPLMPFLRSELRLSYTVGSLHFSAFALGTILGGLTSDRVLRWWGRGVGFWGGATGMAAGAILLVLGRLAALTIAGAFIMGGLGGLLLVTIQATLADRHGERRATALTESNIVASAGATLVPLCIGGFQNVGLGWRAALYLMVPVLLILALSFRRVSFPVASKPLVTSSGSRHTLPLAFWAYWAVVVLSVSIEWCIIFWGANFLISVVGLEKVIASTIMSIFFLAELLGRMAASWLTRRASSARLLVGALALTMIGFPLFWLAPLAPLNIVGLFLAGLGIANLFPLTLSVAVGIDPEQSNTASARISLGIGIALLVAPLALGWAADQVGIQHAYSLVAVLLVIALLVTIGANRQRGSTVPAALQNNEEHVRQSADVGS